MDGRALHGRNAEPPRPAEPVAPAGAAALIATRAILDVRDAAAFARGHLPGSGHVPHGEFVERRAELPPREQPVLVVGAAAAAAEAAARHLVQLGFRDVRWLDAPLEAFDAFPGGAPDTAPAVPLWRANPFLAEVAPILPRGGRALDLACGSGRDAVFLAGRGFDVDAWDIDTQALLRANALARRNGVELRTLICDLEGAAAPLADDAWDLIVCFRFLHRPLLPRIARGLRPGGHVVYETYRVGQERFGKPSRRRFLLADGELRAAFDGLEILRYEEPSPPRGPWTARLCARRSC